MRYLKKKKDQQYVLEIIEVAFLKTLDLPKINSQYDCRLFDEYQFKKKFVKINAKSTWNWCLNDWDWCHFNNLVNKYHNYSYFVIRDTDISIYTISIIKIQRNYINSLEFIYYFKIGPKFLMLLLMVLNLYNHFNLKPQSIVIKPKHAVYLVLESGHWVTSSINGLPVELKINLRDH